MCGLGNVVDMKLFSDLVKSKAQGTVVPGTVTVGKGSVSSHSASEGSRHQGASVPGTATPALRGGYPKALLGLGGFGHIRPRLNRW